MESLCPALRFGLGLNDYKLTTESVDASSISAWYSGVVVNILSLCPGRFN